MPHVRTHLTRHRLMDCLIGALLCGGSLLIYLRTLAPSVAAIFDDSLEFQLVCYQPGIAHPTGYPLYTLLGKIFTYLPLGNVAYRVNLMSAVFGALTVALLYGVLKLIVTHRVPAILGAATFAVSPVFWSQAVIAEVYTLNAAFMALTILLLLSWARTYQEPTPSAGCVLCESTTILSVLAIVCGLSLTHHRTMLLLTPGAIIFMLMVDRRLFTNGRLLARLAILLVAPLALYLYIPLRGTAMSSLDGVYQNTLEGFIKHVTAGSYGIFLIENPLQQSRNLAFYIALLRDQFTWPGIVLGFLGFAWSFRRPKAAALLAVSFATIAVFAAGYRVPDIEVFLIPIFLICAVYIGLAISALWDSFVALADRFAMLRAPRFQRAIYLLLLVGGALLPIYLWQAHRAENDLSQRWEVHDYGVDMLSQPVEDDAVIVGILGEMTLLNYFQQTDGLRPQLVTIPADTEDERLATVRSQVNAGHPVYLTRPLTGVDEEYHLSSVGPLIRVRERPPTIPNTPRHPLSLPFGEAIVLTGYDADLRDTHLGQNLRATLYWQAVEEIREDYKISVRLVDDEGHLGGAHDAFPVRDAYRTPAWRPGEIIVDSHDLPILAGLPPADYAIQVTLYRPDTLTPLASAPVGRISLGPTIGLERAGPWDVQHEMIADLGGRLRFLGYSMIGDEFRPGDSVPLTFLWQGLAELDGEYHLVVWLEDDTGTRWGEARLTLGGQYPPSGWQQGQIVRDWHSVLMPGNVEDGSYRVRMQVLAGSEPLARRFWLLPTRTILELGQVKLEPRERSFTVPSISHPLEMRFGQGIRLLGYALDQTIAEPGGSLHLTLYWQCLGPLDTSYTVFVHLLDEEGSIRAQCDDVPRQGALPTTSWVEGEVIVDEYQIPIASDAPSAAYTLAVGMYDADTGLRLPVFDTEGNLMGDHANLPGLNLAQE